MYLRTQGYSRHRLGEISDDLSEYSRRASKRERSALESSLTQVTSVNLCDKTGVADLCEGCPCADCMVMRLRVRVTGG